MSAVRIPAPAIAVESGVPACPDPMMMASYFCEMVMLSLPIGI
jgi:hypothetical protein